MNTNKIGAAIAALGAAGALALGAGSAQATPAVGSGAPMKSQVCYWQEYSDGWGNFYVEWVCF